MFTATTQTALDKEKAWQRTVLLTLITLAVFMVGTESVLAFAPANTTGFGYDIYDFVVNKLLNGPIGSLIGVGVIIGGFVLAYKNNWMGAVLLLAVGIGALKAQSLSQSLGYNIPLIS